MKNERKIFFKTYTNNKERKERENMQLAYKLVFIAIELDFLFFFIIFWMRTVRQQKCFHPKCSFENLAYTK